VSLGAFQGIRGVELSRDALTHDDPCLPIFAHLTKDWTPASQLRTDLARRQAEILGVEERCRVA
jgi:hypothetical protein